MKLRALKSLVGLVVDPSRIGDVFALGDALMDDHTRAAMLAHIGRHEQGAVALRERPRLGAVDLPSLRALPDGTLGRAYAEHVDRSGVDPASLPVRATPDARSYLLGHIYETHDLWHTVTGFGCDVAGELGLMAFYAAQAPSKGPLAILVAGLVNTMFFHMEDKDARFDAIVRGWWMGRRARPLFGVPWNRLWEVPLEDIRRRWAVDPALAAALTFIGDRS